MELKSSGKKRLKQFQRTVCKNTHDINIFNIALKVKAFQKSYVEEDDPRIHIRRKSMVFLISNLTINWIKKYIDEPDVLLITRWFYTQKILDFVGVDPVLPSLIDKNEGLWYELTRRNIPINEIPHLENLIHQMIKSFNLNDLLPVQNVFVQIDNDRTILKYGPVKLEINTSFYNSLSESYLRNPDNVINLMNSRIFNLTCRYQTLVGSGYHAGIPEDTFYVLTKYLKVSHEIFSSPFNHILDNYTSAYPDTDQYFGSKGNFFNIYPDLLSKGGSFEANPPFLEEYMCTFALIIINYLSKDIALSFFVIFPAWTDTVLYNIFMTSRYNVLPGKYISFERHKHYYRDGAGYLKRDNILRKSNNKSLVFILQNIKGSEKYPVIDEFLIKLNESFTKYNLDDE